MITCLLLGACSGPLSMLDPAGPSAYEAARLWWGLFSFFTLVLVVVSGLWFYAMYRQPGHDSGTDESTTQRRLIIGGGILLPVVSIVIILAFGIPASNRMNALTDGYENVLTIEVTGHRWWWEVVYPDGGPVLVDQIYIPTDTPVRLLLSSVDVIHSLWLPRLGGKLDAIPGHVNELQIQVDETGVYLGACAEFCGVGHTHMRLELHAHSQEAFDAWLLEQGSD